MAGRKILWWRSCATVEIIQSAENRRVARCAACCWGLRLVQSRMGEITTEGLGFDDGPGSVALFELVSELHRARTLLHMELDLSLRVIAVNGDLLHISIEGLQIQVPVVSDVRLNSHTDSLIRASVRGGTVSGARGIGGLPAAGADGDGNDQRDCTLGVHDDVTLFSLAVLALFPIGAHRIFFVLT